MRLSSILLAALSTLAVMAFSHAAIAAPPDHEIALHEIKVSADLNLDAKTPFTLFNQGDDIVGSVPAGGAIPLSTGSGFETGIASISGSNSTGYHRRSYYLLC